MLDLGFGGCASFGLGSALESKQVLARDLHGRDQEHGSDFGHSEVVVFCPSSRSHSFSSGQEDALKAVVL